MSQWYHQDADQRQVARITEAVVAKLAAQLPEVRAAASASDDELRGAARHMVEMYAERAGSDAAAEMLAELLAEIDSEAA